MDSQPHRSFLVGDRSHLALIKKEIHVMAREAGFSEVLTGRVDIIIAEIGSNFVKHAGGGELLVRTAPGCIDILAIDNGPGMNDAVRMLEDGQSTSNTLGGGLGAIKRLSSQFQLYSRKGWGTVLFAQLQARTKAAPAPGEALPFQLYNLLVPYPGEVACGDGFRRRKFAAGQHCLFLGDGLGHGPEAEKAIHAAAAVLADATDPEPAELLRAMHAGVKKTRGLVATCAVYSTVAKQWRICGIGNIATRAIQGPSAKNHLAYNGIVGHTIPRTLNPQLVALSRGGYLVLCSDGIRSRWELADYPGIHRYPPCVLAAALYKDAARRTDDASVVVVRMQ